ncbi:MAG: AAA family ATPase, partial [Eubacteriales bacterium]|nr:AAA family ATPase [Eubacteriales bacterium]
ALENVLDEQLQIWEAQSGAQYQAMSLGQRFEQLLSSASAGSGRKCVVLIDEYDKPLLEAVEDPVLEEHNKNVFKSFFSVLKKEDSHIHFVFITGVTKFSKVSIFSDLNQLNDISLDEDFAGICGITEAELTGCFAQEISALAKSQDLSPKECLAELRRAYDGYHFHPKGTGVYNPFSLLKAFYSKEFGSYWFETGTPTFLVRRLRAAGYDIRKFTSHTLYASEAMLSDFRADNPDLTPLLYQTGYLTIVDFDRVTREYTLAYPNEEVKYGFLENLLPEYAGNCGAGSGKDIFTLRRYIERGELDNMKDVFIALFAGIPYTTDAPPFEHYFQTVIYLVFTLLGKFSLCEMHTFKGRIDCVLEAANYVYIFEFKRDDTAENALKQINESEYALPYAADLRQIIKIGVSFDSESRILKEWKAVRNDV